MSVLEVKGVSKSFDGEEIIRDITLKLNEGEIVSLLGGSCGLFLWVILSANLLN